MLRFSRLLIALLFVTVLGLQIAASWHSAEHMHEEGAKHVCTLCMVKSGVAVMSTGLALVAVAVLFSRRQVVWGRVVRLAQPTFKPRSRGPPVCI